MTEKTFATELARLVIAATDQYAGRVQLSGRPGMVRLELFVFFAWLVTQRIRVIFSSSDVARPILDVVHSCLFIYYEKTGREAKSLEKMMHTRYAGYYAAWEAAGRQEDQIPNICKYLAACCGTDRLEVPFESIIPDPDDFVHVADCFTPETLKALRALKQLGYPTYPLRTDVMIQISNMIGSTATQVDGILRNALAQS